MADKVQGKSAAEIFNEGATAGWNAAVRSLAEGVDEEPANPYAASSGVGSPEPVVFEHEIPPLKPGRSPAPKLNPNWPAVQPQTEERSDD